MKKYIILAALFLASCGKYSKKCNCDKITSVESSNWHYGNRTIIGNQVWYETIYTMKFNTTNECDGKTEAFERDIAEKDLGKTQKVNECFDEDIVY